jgi:hypothetical protein
MADVFDPGYSPLRYFERMALFQRQGVEIGIHQAGGMVVCRWGLTRWMWAKPPQFARPVMALIPDLQILTYLRGPGFTALAEVCYG